MGPRAKRGEVRGRAGEQSETEAEPRSMRDGKVKVEVGARRGSGNDSRASDRRWTE